MKREIITYYRLVVAMFFILSVTTKLRAADYTVSFTGSGAATTISSVVVQNLTQGTSVTVQSGASLVLTDVTAIPQLDADKSLLIYPNPIVEKATVSFFSKQGGNTDISVFGIDGRCLIREAKTLNIGLNQFKLSLPNGVFTIHINENGVLHYGTVISQSDNKAEFEYIGTENAHDKPIQKVESSAFTLKYSAGDQLLFKGISGNYSTIVTDKPTSNKTINFNFVECKDGDGNYYPVVQIGTQVWMAENLKTTKYNDGTAIPLVKDNTAWAALSTPAYCWYNNDATAYKNKYGALYNWYVINTAKLAPVGWHVCTDAELTTLTTYLGGQSVAGGKLKETGTLNWASPNTSATNESGFSALPGGIRFLNIFDNLGLTGNWWSSTEDNAHVTYYRHKILYYNYSATGQGSYTKELGLSVRCLMGDVAVLSTIAATSITTSSATSGGNITYDGNASVTAREVCWNTTGNPTITDSKTNEGIGTGSFTSNLTGLTPNTTYYARAYATNSFGTGYGSQISFSTPDIVRLVSACGSITRSYSKAYQNVKSSTQTDITAQTDVYLSKNSSPSYPKLPQTVTGAKALTVNDPTVVVLPYNTSVDLVNYITPIFNSAIFNTAGYGLNYKFDLLNETGNTFTYNTGSSNTDQQQFIRINDAARGTIQASDATSAQGTTPIVRVTMYNPQNPTCSVLMSFIKIYMGEKPRPTPVSIPITFADAAVPCSDAIAVLSSAQMNQIYSAIGLSMSEFNQMYSLTYSGEGVISQNASTNALQWTLTTTQIWNKTITTSSATFSGSTVYTPLVPSLYPKVTVLLSRRFTKPVSLDIPSSQLISIFWYSNTVKHTINLPSAGETNSAFAVFQNNINQAFVQNANMSLNGLSNYEYYFVPSQPTHADGINTKLTVSADGQTLLNGSEIVATINPFVTNLGDVLILNKASATAKRLLNYSSEFLKARIGIRSLYCSNLPQYKMPVTISGYPYFDVVFVRPINPVANSSLYFKDGLNYGDPNTYLGISSLVNLNDWRYPSTVASFATHSNYYQYYGITNITVDVPNIKTDLNQTGSTLVLLSSIPYLRVSYSSSIAGVTPVEAYGYITYNNTTGISLGKTFYLYVPVTITYAWGSIVTTQIQISVGTSGPMGIKSTDL